VLIDTGEFHYRAWAATLAEFGIPYSRELFKATFGMNNAGTLTVLLDHAPAPELLAAVENQKESTFRASIHGQAAPLPGVVEWLGRFKARGFPQAVASSAPPENIDALIDELHLRPYFAALVSGASLPGKPDPAVFLEAARQLHVASAHCLVVEDSPAGVQAAKRAGMKCLAILTTNPAPVLSVADMIVERLDTLTPELLNHLSKL
jgi:HAD superfamily hydrolase (TIGR01509 family)